ncbi:GNAT family N-acetyltransferase [Exiguobacterium oxidotolerans]|uniref:GNAT family N-acetyltransferase n=1 Tax=Exiguobacterium oxidotolerans TaxID=223958 RepID=UPI0004940DD2|nr:GNAT family N-acetyltransferase [Exiguobacterium oxidotolerans]
MSERQYQIRPYTEQDFEAIQRLNAAEGWSNLVARSDETKRAFAASNVTYVVVIDGTVSGYIRGMTDTAITLYICELLIADSARGRGLGQALLGHAHAKYPATRLEILASASSHSFYEQLGYRPFHGFRKTIDAAVTTPPTSP